MNAVQLSIALFLQIAVILVVCRGVGWLARRLLGQPQVVGEMIAGVLIGPSVFGAAFPHAFERLFPHDSRSVIYVIAQIGLALYMFIVGMEFRLDIVRARARSAATVSLAGIVTPFALGGALAALFHHDRTLFAEGVSLPQAILFLGAVMSITAFPMLARIIHEGGLAGTRVGTLALAAGSLDDAAAWCLLAAVLASFGNDPSIAGLAIGGGVLYVLLAAFVLRPALRPLGRAAEGRGEVSSGQLALVLALLALAAWYTDVIGIYAVFGAFILGAVMPRGAATRELTRAIHPLTTALLLPMFFVHSGLNTQIALVNTPGLLLLAGLVLAAACVGKGVACWAAARLHGESPRDAFAIGALMNARGLMELIILNIGLQRGLITPTLFSIMVMMAIVTTLMATPLFEWVYRRSGKPASEPLPAVE